MNKIGVYHGDVKEGNILFNLNTQRIGLIDWGLSFSTNSTNAKIPKLLKNKPLQYNLPFSIILFNFQSAASSIMLIVFKMVSTHLSLTT